MFVSAFLEGLHVELTTPDPSFIEDQCFMKLADYPLSDVALHRSSAHGALLEMSKAELLLIHASIVSTLSHDLQSALSCYQLVIGLLQNICPTNGRPPSSSLWTSSAGLPGYRHAHAVHAVRYAVSESCRLLFAR